MPWWSRWSGSTLVITAPCGVKDRNEPSRLVGLGDEDVAGAVVRAGARTSVSSPPMANDGSSPACCSATVSIEVVEVLPWVPATHTPRHPAISAASASARRTTGIPRRARPRPARGCPAGPRWTPRPRRAAGSRSGSPRRGRPRVTHPAGGQAGQHRRVPGVRTGHREARGRAGCGRCRSSRPRRRRPGGAAQLDPVRGDRCVVICARRHDRTAAGVAAPSGPAARRRVGVPEAARPPRPSSRAR